MSMWKKDLLLGITGALVFPLFLGTRFFSPYYAWSATAVATISMSGDIGDVFEMNVSGTHGDLDLSPKIIVTNRVIGLLHLKYNVDMASFILKSSTASGLPEKGGVAYNFGATSFQVSVGTCSTVDPAKVPVTPINLAAGATDIKSAASAALSAGIEEDCPVTASWSGANVGVPLSGIYSMSIDVTLTSI